jgi:kynurenine formamidase
MVKGGIPGIENVGGDLDEIVGKRSFFIAFPWRWRGGDGCIVRVLAITDPDGDFRFEKGE